MTEKPKQIAMTLPLGSNSEGEERKRRWRQAAAKTMMGNAKLFNAWIRAVVDAEANRILKK